MTKIYIYYFFIMVFSEGMHSVTINFESESNRELRERAVRNYVHQERIHIFETKPSAGSPVTCGDGRSEVKRIFGETIASFGEHITDARTLFTAAKLARIDLSPTDAVLVIREIVEAAGGKFSGHSDEHVEGYDQEDGPCIGCADANLPTKRAHESFYNIEAYDALTLVNTAREVFAVNNGLTVFRGDHQEKDLLVITGRQATVPHANSTEQHFVYDLGRNAERLQAVHREIQNKFTAITWDIFFKIYIDQLSATNTLLLEPKKLKYYAVNADNPDDIYVEEFDTLASVLASVSEKKVNML